VLEAPVAAHERPARERAQVEAPIVERESRLDGARLHEVETAVEPESVVLVGARAAADGVRALEHEYLQAALSQLARAGEACDPATDDKDVRGSVYSGIVHSQNSFGSGACRLECEGAGGDGPAGSVERVGGSRGEPAGGRGRLGEGVRAAAPIALGPLLFGLSFGLLAESAGMSTSAAVVFSATTFAGSAQFAAATILEDGGTALAAVVAAVLLNARYAPMSVAVAGLFHGPAWRRLVESQLIVDESWALAGRSGRFQRHVLLGAGLLLYVLWTTSTAAGTVVGDRLGDPSTYGLDAAFAALFLGLALPYLRSRRALGAGLTAAAITLAFLPWTPAGAPLLAASAACLLGLRR
jgi:branched chain amino acid efflux pump